MSAPYTGQYAALNQYTPLTQKYGSQYGVDPTLLDALIWRESRGNKMATNGSAMGLTQFTPIGMAQFGVSNPYDPAQSIKGAAEYLSKYSAAGVSGALQAYNAGAPGKTTEIIVGVPYEDAVISTAQSLEAQSGATAPAGSLSAGVASQVPTNAASQAPGNSAGRPSPGGASLTPGTSNGLLSTLASLLESSFASWLGGTLGAVLVMEMLEGAIGGSASISTGEIVIAAVIGAAVTWGGMPSISGVVSERFGALVGGAENAVGNAIGKAAAAVSTPLGNSSMAGYAGFSKGGSAALNSIWSEYLSLMDQQLGLPPHDWSGYVPSISGSGGGK